METWRAIMTQGVYNADAAASKASRYGVLDDESDKLAQPLISRRDSDDVPSNYSHYDYPTFQDAQGDDEEALEYGHGEHHGLLRKQHSGGYEEIPLKPSPVAVLRTIVTNVLWPMTAVGAQTAKVFNPRPKSTRDAVAESDDRHALHTVTTLRAQAKPRRRVESLDELHERALMRMAVVTIILSAWLIFTVYRHAD